MKRHSNEFTEVNFGQFKDKGLPLDEVLRLNMQAGIVSNSGRKEIRAYLRENFGFRDRLEMPLAWVTKEGKLSKRIAKQYKNSTGNKLPQEALSEIGNIAKRLTSDNEPVYVELSTDKPEWGSHNFGAGSSCYWNERAPALDALFDDPRAMSIRTWQMSHGELYDFGRAWAVATLDGTVVFNAYGSTKYQFASYLAFMIGGQTKAIKVNNWGKTEQLIWVNNGNGTLVVPEVTPDTPKEIDLQISEADAEECGNCYHWSFDITRVKNGNLRCEDCISDYYLSCEHCLEFVLGEEIVDVGHHGDEVCLQCRREDFEECQHCQTYVEIGTVADTGHCEQCAEELVS